MSIESVHKHDLVNSVWSEYFLSLCTVEFEKKDFQSNTCKNLRECQLCFLTFFTEILDNFDDIPDKEEEK